MRIPDIAEVVQIWDSEVEPRYEILPFLAIGSIVVGVASMMLE